MLLCLIAKGHKFNACVYKSRSIHLLALSQVHPLPLGELDGQFFIWPSFYSTEHPTSSEYTYAYTHGVNTDTDGGDVADIKDDD